MKNNIHNDIHNFKNCTQTFKNNLEEIIVGDIIIFKRDDYNHINYQKKINIGKIVGVFTDENHDEYGFIFRFIDNKGNSQRLHTNHINGDYTIINQDNFLISNK